MNPNTDQTPVPIPSEPIQQEVVIQNPKPKSPFIFYLLSFILGIALTLTTLILFNIDLNTLLGLEKKEEIVNNQDNNKLPTQEVKEKEVEKETFVYQNKDVLVEYWKDNTESAKTFVASLPATSTIEIGGTSTVRVTKVTYTDDVSGTTILSLSFPHFGLAQELKSFEKLSNSDLYRVNAKASPEIVEYAKSITLTGQCDSADTKIPAPCGSLGITVDNVNLLISVSNSKNDFSVADKIVESLKLK